MKMRALFLTALFFVLNGQSLTAQTNCTLNIGNDTVFCGNPFQLIAGAGYQSYTWNTGSTAASISVTAPGIYAVTVTQIGQNVVNNGNFQQGNTGFFCAYTYNPSSVWNEGTYAVTNNANFVHSNFQGLDHTNPPTGNFLVCNGSGVAGTIVWQQTVNVIPGIQYIFSTWLATLVASNPALIQFYINGVPFGPIFPAPNITHNWIQFYTTWFSGTSTTATISIVNQNTILSGNDFGIDDIYFAPIIPCVDSVTVSASQLAGSIAPTNVKCFGESTGSADLTVAGGFAPFSFNWSNGQTSQNLSAVPANTYTVTISDVAGCSATVSSQINQPNLPLTVDYTITDILCAGDQNGAIDVTVAGGVSPYSYAWGISTQQDLINIGGGTYTLTLTDAVTCIRQFTMSVFEPAPINLNLVSQNISCNGDTNGFITANVTGGMPDYLFQWSQGQPNYAITNLGAGTYTVTVSDINNCSETATATLTEPQPILLYTSGDRTICLSESAEIVAAAVGGVQPYQFFWVPGGLATSTMTVSPEQSTEYCVYVKDDNHCISNERCVSVYVNPPLDLTVTLSEDTICEGDSVLIQTLVQGGNGGPYVIEKSGTGAISAEYYYRPDFSQNIIIYAYDACGTPTVMKSVHIELLPTPHAGFQSDKINGCQPLGVQFSNTNPGLNETYQWDFSDAGYFNQSHEKNPLYTFRNPGVYTVSLEVTNAMGCKNKFTHLSMIEVYPAPLSLFSASETSASTANPSIEFLNQSTLANDFIWAFGDGDSSYVVNPMPHTYHLSGTYLVSLIAQSTQGCRDTSYIKVEITDYPSFYVPNAINPFSYLQQNRIFKPQGYFIGIKDYHLSIYNRWGEPIFISTEPEIGWDGKLSDGTNAPMGSYTWLIKYLSADRTPILKTGAVNVIY